MHTLEVRDTGLVYRNPNPNLRSIHAWHPTLNLDRDGHLIASFDLAEAVEAFDYATYVSRSADGGRTWDPPRRLLAPELVEDPARRTVHSARPALKGDGEMVALVGRYHREDFEEGIWNRQTLGVVDVDLLWTTSADQGRSWRALRLIDPPLGWRCWEVAHRPVPLRDGRLLLPLSILKDWHGKRPGACKALAVVSADGGRTWPRHLDVLDDYAHGIIHFEQSLVELADGRLLAVGWAFHESSGTTRGVNYALSDGGPFTPPRDTGLRGETAKLVALPGGGAVCVYRGIEPAGLCAAVVAIDGDTWRHGEPVVAWRGPTVSRMYGERSSADELAALKLGHPSPIVLPDGDVLAAFWCHEEEVYNIRWVRLGLR